MVEEEHVRAVKNVAQAAFDIASQDLLLVQAGQAGSKPILRRCFCFESPLGTCCLLDRRFVGVDFVSHFPPPQMP